MQDAGGRRSDSPVLTRLCPVPCFLLPPASCFLRPASCFLALIPILLYIPPA